MDLVEVVFVRVYELDVFYDVGTVERLHDLNFLPNGSPPLVVDVLVACPNILAVCCFDRKKLLLPRLVCIFRSLIHLRVGRLSK